MVNGLSQVALKPSVFTLQIETGSQPMCKQGLNVHCQVLMKHTYSLWQFNLTWSANVCMIIDSLPEGQTHTMCVSMSTTRSTAF